MANEAYIYRLRADLGTVAQITDLTPNSSRKTAVLKGQSGYMAPVRQTADVVTLAANPTVQDYDGLEAYLLSNTADEASGVSITGLQAHTCAAAIIALLDAGNPVTISALNDVFIAVCGAGSVGTMPFVFLNEPVADADGAGNAGVLSGGTASVGSQSDFMKACCGGEYTLATGAVGPGIAPVADEGSFEDDYRQLFLSGSFASSLAQGDLSIYTSATDFTYLGVTAAACVAYSVDGTVLS